MIPFLEFPCISCHSSLFSLTTSTELFSCTIKCLRRFSALFPTACMPASHFFCCFPSVLHASIVQSYLEWENNIFPYFWVVLNSFSCLSCQVAGWNKIKGTAIVPLMSSRFFWPHFLSYFILISQQNSSCTSSSVKRSIFQLWFILFISHEENSTAALWNLDACSRVAELTVATFIQYKMKYIQARCLGNCYTVKLNFKSHFTKIN